MKLRPEHVKGARGMLSLSLEDLANASGVSENTIWRFEKGETVPKDETLFRIQAALEQRGIVFSNGDRPGVALDTAKALRD